MGHLPRLGLYMISVSLCLALQHAFINFICIQLLLFIFSPFAAWLGYSSCSSLLRQQMSLNTQVTATPWRDLCGFRAFFLHGLTHLPSTATSSLVFHLHDSLSHKFTQASLAHLLTTALIPEEKTYL